MGSKQPTPPPNQFVPKKKSLLTRLHEWWIDLNACETPPPRINLTVVKPGALNKTYTLWKGECAKCGCLVYCTDKEANKLPLVDSFFREVKCPTEECGNEILIQSFVFGCSPVFLGYQPTSPPPPPKTGINGCWKPLTDSPYPPIPLPPPKHP